MNAIIIIEYTSALLIAAYSIGLLLIWIYERRKILLYQKIQTEIKMVEDFSVGSAIKHIKIYKITEDYRRRNSDLEAAQQFILKICFFTNRNERIEGRLLFRGK